MCEVLPMMIPCVSCNSMFRLDNIHIKTSGSKVRCSKCHDIFMVYPPENYTESDSKISNPKDDVAVVIPYVQESLLDDLFQVQNNSNDITVATGSIEESDNYLIDSFESVEDFEEVEEDEDIECANLPDLSEFESMIDWDEGKDSENISQNDNSKPNSI